MIEHGIVLDGRVLPGTEWVLRDTEAQWDYDVLTDRADLRRRAGNRIVIEGKHWTAGPSRFGEGSARRVVAAMKARRRDSNKDGKLTKEDELMDVSVHFVLSTDGLVFQTADLRYGTVHMGRRVNLRSIGEEHCWPGTEEQAKELGEECEVVVANVRGNRVRVAVPDPRMVAASVRLSATLAALSEATDGFVAIPRVTARASIPATGGVIEHFQYPGTTKVDCAGLMLDALRAAGWR